MGKVLEQLASHSPAYTRFANAARTSKRHEAHLWALQEATHRHHLALSANEWGEWSSQGIGEQWIMACLSST